jgi:hypothetical protein
MVERTVDTSVNHISIRSNNQVIAQTGGGGEEGKTMVERTVATLKSDSIREFREYIAK